MRLKPEVEPSGVASEVWFALGVAEALHPSANLVVTSMRDGKHNSNSLHPHGLAADIRTLGLSVAQKDAYVAELKEKLTPMGFDVVLEVVGSTPATTSEHCHIEYDPRPGRGLIVRT